MENNIHKTFAVLGLSKFGMQTAISLFQHGAEVIAVDRNESVIQKIAPEVTKAVSTDLLDWEALEHIGVFNVDVVIIGLREAFEATVLIVNHLKTKTPIKKIIALVDSDEKAEVLHIMGVDRVIFPENEMANRLVQRLTMPKLVDEILVSPETRIIEIDCPSDFVHKSLVDLNIRSEYKIYVISIVRNRENEKPVVLIAPEPNTLFEASDKIVLLGNSKNLVEFTKKFNI